VPHALRKRIRVIVTRERDQYELRLFSTLEEEGQHQAIGGRTRASRAARRLLTEVFAPGDTIEYAAILFTNVDDTIRTPQIALGEPQR